MLKGCLLTFGRLILSVGRRSCDEIIESYKKSGQFVKGEIEMNRLFEAITNDAVLSEPWAELGITRRKILQYLSLFWVLWVIYSICLSSYYKFLMAEPAAGFGFGDVMKPLIGPCLISTLPFAALAYSDKTWRSGDAAGVILGVWIAVYIGLSFQYDKLCLLPVAIPLAPFILSAQLAHTIGTLCQPKRHDDMKSTYRP